MRTHRFPDGTTPVVVSADTNAMLRAEGSALADYVMRHPETDPDTLSDMLFRTRPTRRYRAVVLATDGTDLLDALGAVASGASHPNVVRSDGPARRTRTAFVFPGQGGHRPGMGALYYRNVPSFAAEADRIHDTFLSRFGSSPRAYLLGEAGEVDENAALVQPANFMQMSALAAMWRSFGVNPEFAVGHSQGEIAAGHVADVLDLDDAVTLVGTRARAVDTIATEQYAMAVVDADRAECEAILARHSGWAQISVINSPRMTGISGYVATVNAIVDELSGAGRFGRVIAVRYPAHTAVMHSLADEVLGSSGPQLSANAFRSGSIPCIGATLGAEITPDLPLRDYWFWNLRNIVRFDKAIGHAVELGADTFIELSDHPTLTLSVRETLSAITERPTSVVGTSNRTASDLCEVTRNLATIAAQDIGFDWNALNSGDTQQVLPLIDFPHTATDNSFLWMTSPRPARSVVAAVPERLRASAQPAVQSGPRTDVVTIQWRRIKRRSTLAPLSLGIIQLEDSSAPLADALIENANTFGATARRLVPTSTDSSGVDAVVVLAPPNIDTDAGLSVRIRESIAQAAAFFGERRWATDAGPQLDHWLVTTGAEAVSDGEVPNIAHSGIAAGFRCLGAEYPQLNFRHLDLGNDLAAGVVDPGAARKIVAALHTAREPELALRGGDLHVKRLVVTDPVPAPSMTTTDHVLIVGGTGKVGMEFAEYFAAGRSGRVTLVSRSGETPGVRARLDRAHAGDSAVVVLRCDITDDNQVASLGARLDTPVDLVIHAAADLPQQAGIDFNDIETDHVHRLCDAKVLGVQRILSSVPLADNARVLLCSSLAATLGGRGTIVYSVANAMLDAMAIALRADGTACSSIEWGQWAVHDGSGAADTSTLAAIGYLPMPSRSAIEAGIALRDNAIVTAFDWARGSEVLGAFGYAPLLSELTVRDASAVTPPQPITGALDASSGTDTRSAAAPDHRGRALKLVADVLGVSDVEAIDTTRPLVALGLDSLQALELRRKVTEEFGYELPVTELVGGASLDDVVALLRKHAPDVTSANYPTVQAASTGPAQRSNPLTPNHRVRELVADVLGVSDVEAIDTTRPLVGLGLDSLQALELRRKVTVEFGYELPVTELVGGASLDDIIALLGDRTGTGTVPDAPVAVAPPSIDSGPAPIAAGATLAERVRAGAQQVITTVLDYDQVHAARTDIDRIGLSAMMSALEPVFADGARRTPDEIGDALSFADRHRWLLRQWLEALAGSGALVVDENGAYRVERAVPAAHEPDLNKVCAIMGYRPVLAEFLRACNNNLVALGQDTMRVQELLFSGGGTDTAEAAYRENLISAYLNRAARVTISELVEELGVQRTPVRILELGAGVGGTTNDVVAGLAETAVALDYHFTDVSEFFLSAARKHFAPYPWMRFGLLDMNGGLGDVTDRYDIVVASNVLHNAQHIGQTLKELHDLLKPGGAVVIIESTYAYAQLLTSVQFLMSPAVGQPHAGAADVRAGRRIFLSESEWIDELSAAGLRPEVVLPPSDHALALLDQRVFVAIRGV